MTTHDPNDLTFIPALKAVQPYLKAARLDDIMVTPRDIEPQLRDWLARADALSEEQWMDEAVETRAFYEELKRYFAEHDAPTQEGNTQP